MRKIDDRPKALILMATRNGERFVAQQVDSILNQRDVAVHLFISDDYSSDSTRQIIAEMVPENQLTFITQTPPLGLPGNFLWLLDQAPSGFDMYALSDQDDIWNPNKLRTAWEVLRSPSNDQATLWISRVLLIDESGGQGEVFPTRWQSPTFGNALVDSIGPGCAMVWNSALQKELTVPLAKDCTMHDSWIYLTAAALGQVRYEHDPYIHYRLHDKNSVGIANKLPARIRRFRKTLTKIDTSWEQQTHAFLNCYHASLSKDDLQVARSISLGLRRKRVRYWSMGILKRKSPLDNLMLFVRLLVVI